MRTLFANRPLLAVLLCSLLLMLRVGGAHLHMCYDGLEAATSLHMLDVGVEHSAEAGVNHQDTNISISASEAIKPSAFVPDIAPVLLLALLVLLLLPARVVFLRGTSTEALREVHWLRPPLRGPPLTAIS